MARGYSDQQKAAVLSALLAGQGVTDVARSFGIPEGTVKSWWSRQRNGENVATVATPKREVIGEMLVGYLEETIATMRAQLKVFADESYIKKQSAADAAVLHGVIADKGFRLLEALDGGNADGDEEEA
jgi:transposase-like protein